MGQWNERNNPIHTYKARFIRKFGDRLVNPEDIQLLNTQFPFELVCKEHGAYHAPSIIHACRWRGKGAPYCPECGKPGRPPGARNKPSVPVVLSPEKQREHTIKGLLCDNNWRMHFKYEDISLAKWRKRMRQLLEQLDPEFNLSQYEFSRVGLALIDEERNKSCSARDQ